MKGPLGTNMAVGKKVRIGKNVSCFICGRKLNKSAYQIWYGSLRPGLVGDCCKKKVEADKGGRS